MEVAEEQAEEQVEHEAAADEQGVELQLAEGQGQEQVED